MKLDTATGQFQIGFFVAMGATLGVVGTIGLIEMARQLIGVMT